MKTIHHHRKKSSSKNKNQNTTKHKAGRMWTSQEWAYYARLNTYSWRTEAEALAAIIDSALPVVFEVYSVTPYTPQYVYNYQENGVAPDPALLRISIPRSDDLSFEWKAVILYRAQMHSYGFAFIKRRLPV